MLNTKPHMVTHGVDGDAMTLVFYPDTGCLRFVDARGICHELRPPHSWFAISSASRGVRRSTQAMTEGLNALLHEFCAKRPRWLIGSARRPSHMPLTLSTHAPVHATMAQLTTNEAVAR